MVRAARKSRMERSWKESWSIMCGMVLLNSSIRMDVYMKDCTIMAGS